MKFEGAAAISNRAGHRHKFKDLAVKRAYAVMGFDFIFAFWERTDIRDSREVAYA
jgi:hypothetical protein